MKSFVLSLALSVAAASVAVAPADVSSASVVTRIQPLQAPARAAHIETVGFGSFFGCVADRYSDIHKKYGWTGTVIYSLPNFNALPELACLIWKY